MSIYSDSELSQLRALSELTFCNPFLPRRLELEQELFGAKVRDQNAVWSYESTQASNSIVFSKLADLSRDLADKFIHQVQNNARCTLEDQGLYEDAALYVLHDNARETLFEMLEDSGNPVGACGKAYAKHHENFLYYARFLQYPEQAELLKNPEHLWACFFQIQRLFYFVYFWIVGSSLPAANLRAEIWQSVLTHNLRRYVRSVHKCMGDISTLIVGPSGTGKELVARAISMSQYIPFDSSKSKFVYDFRNSMLAVHLAAMSPTLIESELFGHRKGSFTGATSDRKGLFESCSEFGTVFLDEIGELSAEIQVKLLRVLQTRTLQRLGDLETQRFTGKVIAATNRNFDSEMKEGNFREDLYYRLCADYIETPSLASQLADRPSDLELMVKHLAFRLDPFVVESLTEEVVHWIEENLGLNYDWPGNVRELEQCLRNVMIRGKYRASNVASRASLKPDFTTRIQEGTLTADELLGYYCTLVYQQTGSYEKAAKRLGMDRRTVKSKIEASRLGELT